MKSKIPKRFMSKEDVRLQQSINSKVTPHTHVNDKTIVVDNKKKSSHQKQRKKAAESKIIDEEKDPMHEQEAEVLKHIAAYREHSQNAAKLQMKLEALQQEKHELFVTLKNILQPSRS